MEDRTVNAIRLVGDVGEEPNIRWYDPTTCAVRFSLATHAPTHLTEEALECSGEVTDWHRVICYRALAEEVGTKLLPGDLVEVLGRLTYTRTYNRQGQFTTHTFVIAKEITLLERKEVVARPATEKKIQTRYGHLFEELEKNPDGLPF
ncbi:single-stranded DNA-binding protein [uncultured Porphyromonas sp.]|uniref:single-stranded DNA-binding protein n=1 Tax=uncultured Porphyromonas sp. TaxID=159274 RepID=UPI0026302017|nr:single-stranded DNA-binding protein [uncultured Porphyromonas sp.]